MLQSTDTRPHTAKCPTTTLWRASRITNQTGSSPRVVQVARCQRHTCRNMQYVWRSPGYPSWF